MTTTRFERRIARQFCSAHNSMPIELVEGNAAPRIEGRGYYWTTPNGTLCLHPNAYRAAYGRPEYHCTTRRVVVGRDWLRVAVAATMPIRRAA